MITIRKYREQDAYLLQQLKYQNKSIEEIEETITLWKEKTYNGSYFEMFAVCDQDEIVGSVWTIVKQEDTFFRKNYLRTVA